MRLALLALVVGALVAACGGRVVSQGAGDSAAHHYSVGVKLLPTDPERARTEFERARSLDPNHAGAWEGLGLVALAAKDYGAAESLLKESKSKDGKYVPAYLGLARVYEAKNELPRALGEAEAAVKLAPANPGAHLITGDVYLHMLDFRRAETSFSKALELDPASSDARRAWDRSVKIRQAAPGTLVGQKIAAVDPITRGELAALLATELGIENQLRKRRPEMFDPSFRAPAAQAPVQSGLEPPTDLANHWARNAIELVMRLGLMESYPDKTFRPDEGVTRAGLAMTLERVLAVAANDPGLRTRYIGQPSPFADVRSDHFAFNAVLLVTTRGLMEAERPNGAFRLAYPVSGPDALVAMRKLAELF